jgi:hypothetical protein
MRFEDVVSIVQNEFKKTAPQAVNEPGVTLNQYDIRAIEHNLQDHLIAKKTDITSIIELHKTRIGAQKIKLTLGISHYTKLRI